jgi:uncharacterized Fe-S cluster protein YjdI
MSERKAYAGAGIVVTFDAEVCQHSGNCVRGLPQVFDVRRRPWIAPDAAPAADVAAAVARCPSGALRYELPSVEGER